MKQCDEPHHPFCSWALCFGQNQPEKAKADPGQIPHAFSKALQSFPTADPNCAPALPVQKGLKSCNWAVSLKNKHGKCPLGLCFYLQNCLCWGRGLCEQERNSFFASGNSANPVQASLETCLCLFYFVLSFAGTACEGCKIRKLEMCLKDTDGSIGLCWFDSSLCN